jgi:N-acetylmuramoyl-L-alanine amidase
MTYVRFAKVDIPEIMKPRRNVFTVFLHCSATDNPKHDNPETIHRWHTVDNGWNEIGYHFFINKVGEIFYGRSLEITPAAQKGHNTGSIAICCHGLEKENFTDAQRHSLRALCIHLNSLYGNGLTFHGHREVEPKKSCPVYPYKVWLRLDENGRMAG